MLVVCPKRLFAVTAFFIFLRSCVVAGGPAGARVPLPTGCRVSKTYDGKELYCNGVSLQEALSAIHIVGGDIEALNVRNCPSRPAGLNQTYFDDNSNLTSVSIHRCNVEKIAPRTFVNLNQLKKLDLGGNKIRQISKEMFKGLANLSSLNLSSNAIDDVLNDSFEDFENLSSLDLGENNIYKFDNKMLTGLKSLEILTLKSQEFGRHSVIGPSYDMLHGLTNLKELNLAEVTITNMVIPKDKTLSLFFQDQVDTLAFLDLRLARLSNSWLPILKNLKRLKYLVLNGNTLGFILDGSLPKVARHGHIDLSSNRIMYVDETAFSDFDGVLSIYDNPFYCDCKLLGFSEWLREVKNSRSVSVLDITYIRCFGPVSLYGTRVMGYSPYWWRCSQYIPYIALVAVIGFAGLLALVTLVVACNRVNFKHWLLERRAAAKAEVEAEEQAAATERSALVPPGRLCGISSLPKGMTGAYILYNMEEKDVKKWVDHHIEEKLYRNPMKITLQWAAGPDFMPLWKQVKDYGFGVKHFLVVVTEELLQDHWPLMSENGGVENLSKFVLVLWGKKKKDLPADLRRLRCPCIEWPVTESKFSSRQRQREQFWKQVRLALKDLSD